MKNKKIDDITNLVNELYDYTLATRSKGYTTMIKKMSEDNDILVVVNSSEDKSHFFDIDPKKLITMNDILNYKLRGQDKMLLFDNHTLIKFMDLVSKRINELEEDKRRKNALLELIKGKINLELEYDG